jgi:hypothetical protein
LSFIGKLRLEQWKNNQGIIEMEAHLPIMRTLANLTIDRDAVDAFARDARFGLKTMILLTNTINSEV